MLVIVVVTAAMNWGSIAEWVRPSGPDLPDKLPTVPIPTDTPAPAPTATMPPPTGTPDRQGLELLAIAAGARCGDLASVGVVVWEVYPSVDDAGRITMRGRIEGEGWRIKDARKSVNALGESLIHPAFTFYALELDKNERGNYSSVGRLWPRDMEGRPSSRRSPNAFADVYEVTSERFDVGATLPSAILGYTDLYVTVWSSKVGTGLQTTGSESAVGACKVWR